LSPDCPLISPVATNADLVRYAARYVLIA
jgi:hypothetical protein